MFQGMKKWAVERKTRRKELREERKVIREQKRARGEKLLPFAKVLMIVMIVMCGQIVIYSEWIMWLYADLSSLYALIGIVAALAGAIWAYCEKSKAENTAGGIVYDAAMRDTPEEEPPIPENEEVQG